MIKSRDELIDFCFHQLGAPVIQIELDEQQVAYCIDLAVERFQNVHVEGSMRRFIPHTITQEDKDYGYIVVPDKIMSIIKVIPAGNGVNTNLSGMGMFNPVYQYRLNDFWDISSGGMSVYNDVMTNLAMVQDMFQSEIGIQFNRHSSRLYLEVDWKNGAGVMDVGKIIVVECFVAVDEDDAPKLYNDWWLKRYATALLKKQWAMNIGKFEGVQLPGGIVINSATLRAQAEQELESLNRELIDENSLPPIFMIG